MIKYKYFKYPFWRYFAYNFLYSAAFGLLPLFCYIAIKLYILLKNNEISENIQLMSLGLMDWHLYKIPLRHLDKIEILLIISWVVLCCAGYVFMSKKILDIVLFNKYKAILIITNIKKVSWGKAFFFSIINCIMSFIGAWTALYIMQYVNVYINLFLCIMQIIGILLSWLLTYCTLNKFIEYFCQIKIKPLQYNS